MKLNPMKNLIVLLVVILGLSSCKQETIRLSGKINGAEISKVALSLKTKKGEEKVILTDIKVRGDKFNAVLKEAKPPLKLTLVLENEMKVDFWVFKYGKLSLELDTENLASIKLNDSFETSELERVNETYNKMYISPLKEQIDWVGHNKSNELNEVDTSRLEEYNEQIKKAYRLRKKSILKTVRKNPQNPIAMALFYDEFESLTKWQKEECHKIAQKYYSDTEMNWQLKN